MKMFSCATKVSDQWQQLHTHTQRDLLQRTVGAEGLCIPQLQDMTMQLFQMLNCGLLDNECR